MLDWRLIVKDPKGFVAALEKSGYSHDEASSACQKVLDLSLARVSKQQEADLLKAKRNQLSQSVGSLMREGKKDQAEAVKLEAKTIGEQISSLEAGVTESEASFNSAI